MTYKSAALRKSEIKPIIERLVEMNPIVEKSMAINGFYQSFYQGNPIVAWIKIITEENDLLQATLQDTQSQLDHYKSRYNEILLTMDKIKGK